MQDRPRVGKGTHLAITHLNRMVRKVSANGERLCFGLKMDIKRFFDSVDHKILKVLLRKSIKDNKVLKYIDFVTCHSKRTSQNLKEHLLGENICGKINPNMQKRQLCMTLIKHSVLKKNGLRGCCINAALCGYSMHA